MASKLMSDEELQQYVSVRELLRLVLGWTVNEALDQGLLKAKVSPIPETFTSHRQYLDCFHWPFLEEIRGQICQGLEGLQYMERVQARAYKRRRVDNTEPQRVLSLEIRPDPDSETLSGKLKSHSTSSALRYSTVTSYDVVLVAEFKPRSWNLRDRRTQSAMGLHSLGIAYAPGDGETTFSVDLFLSQSSVVEWKSRLKSLSDGVQSLEKETTMYVKQGNDNDKSLRSIWVFKLGNLTTGVRIWTAMQFLKRQSASTFPVVGEAFRGVQSAVQGHHHNFGPVPRSTMFDEVQRYSRWPEKSYGTDSQFDESLGKNSINSHALSAGAGTCSS